MADRWIPDDILAMTPKWKNMFDNATTVQFNHRYLVNMNKSHSRSHLDVVAFLWQGIYQRHGSNCPVLTISITSNLCWYSLYETERMMGQVKTVYWFLHESLKIYVVHINQNDNANNDITQACCGTLMKMACCTASFAVLILIADNNV